MEKKIFNIIRVRGMPNKGHLPDGFEVVRQEKFWFEVNGRGRWIKAASYDDHFLYKVPPRYLGPEVRCSCGSMAVIAGYSSYTDMASQQGLLYVCWYHSNYGVHLTGGSRWV